MPEINRNAEFINQKNSQVAEIKRRSDCYMNYILGGYFVTGLLLAFYYNTFGAALFVGGNAVMVYYVVKIALPRSLLYQYILSAVLGIFVVQFTYQMHGMFEMSFFAFIGSAILITYRNWKLQIPILLVIFMHHHLLSQLLKYGYDDIYSALAKGSAVQFFIIHRILTLVIFFICGLWAYHFQKNEENQILQNIELRKLQQEAALNEERNRYLLEIEGQNQRLREISWMQSHIIRAPLARIMGLVPMLEEASHDSEEFNAIVDFIKTSSDELDQVIRNITDNACESVSDNCNVK